MTLLPWPIYFSSPSNDGLVVPNPLRRQLEERGHHIFTQEEDEIDLQIIDITKDGLKHNVITDEEGLDFAVGDGRPSSGVRIISVCSGGSILPLGITSNLTERLFSFYQIRQEYLRTLLCFGEPIHTSQSVVTNYWQSSDEDGSYNLTYKLNFVEWNGRTSGNDPWSDRQIGIYHQHTSSGDLFFLLCSSDESIFPSCLSQLTHSLAHPGPQVANQFTRLLDQPSRLHTELFQAYLDNWGPYFRFLGNRFNKILNDQMGTNIDKIAPETSQQLRSLRNLLDRLAFSTACCQSMAGLCQKLSAFDRLSIVDERSFEAHLSVLQGFVQSSKSLESRILNIISMTVDTLSFHNHTEAARTNREMKDLTSEMRDNVAKTRSLTKGVKELAEKTASDGVVIRVITIVTAIYLPGSFVASIYGMNFFNFSQKTRSIVIASDFWIFLVTWFVFIVVTVLVFYLAKSWDTCFKKRDPLTASGVP